MRNWAGNVAYSAPEANEPTSMDEMRKTVAASSRVKALGSGHSFNDVIDCAGILVSTRGLPLRLEIDSAAAVAEVPASMTYGDLGAQLHRQGWALHNMGSLPHISVAGACATGTHGSGVDNGCLATAAVALELVCADGGVVLGRSGDPEFPGMVLALGSLGIVTRLWLSLQPTYDLAQDVVLDVPSSVVAHDGLALLSSAYSVSIFTSFRDPVTVDAVWRKRRLDAPVVAAADWGGRLADGPMHPITGSDASSATEQLGRPGPWHERLPHFRVEFTPSAGDELQSEFFVPLERIDDVWPELVAGSSRFVDALQVMEIRAVASDGLWLSPFHDRRTLAIHATWVSDPERAIPAVRALEDLLAPFDPRPHWAKVFRAWDPLDIDRKYPDLSRFQRLADRLDPDRHFVNDYIARLGVR